MLERLCDQWREDTLTAALQDAFAKFTPASVATEPTGEDQQPQRQRTTAQDVLDKQIAAQEAYERHLKLVQGLDQPENTYNPNKTQLPRRKKKPTRKDVDLMISGFVATNGPWVPRGQKKPPELMES
eukprot:TRINITY_DN57281_c0_g1_i2.p1 TRINITY_DN57281_c0_g1~~TRINITY_DN57281_c0_g1_i2.p1  ORF type:complete len:127 (+),score=15.44 TRINITY_DN57281_c0_g1_i2:349-729(+)